MDVDELVEEFGEEYRALITQAIAWLKEREPVWGTEPLDRVAFIADLVAHLKSECPHH
jgi:hypothetical protein